MTTRAACPDEATIARLAERLLTERELADLEQHAAECPVCSSTIALLATQLAPEPAGAALFAGRYRMLDVLGAGGMGIVCAALDVSLGRKVAIKRMRHVSRDSGTEPCRARFLREAKLLAALSHPNVVAIYDAGTLDDEPYVVMELVDGWSASRWQLETAPGWRETLDVYLKAGEGLAAAHALGIVHRDVKPDNILVDRTGRVALGDFGLAGLTEAAAQSAESLTSTGVGMGTPAYIAPELLQGATATAASDQYSFCVALFQALHGHFPLVQRASGGPPEPLRPPVDRVPPQIDRLLHRGLSGDPAVRHASMRTLLALLAEAPADRRPRTARRITALLIGGIVLTTALVVAVSRPHRRQADTHQITALPTAAPPVLTTGPIAPRGPEAAALPGEAPPARKSTKQLPHRPAPHAPPAATVGSDQLARATRLASEGDGDGCVAALESSGLPPDVIQIPRAQCEMARGRCDEGRAMLRRVLASRLEGVPLDMTIANEARLYCPLRSFAGANDLLQAQARKVSAYAWNGDQARCVRLLKSTAALAAQLKIDLRACDGTCPHRRALAGIVDDLATCFMAARQWDRWSALDIEAHYLDAARLDARDLVHAATARKNKARALELACAAQIESELERWRALQTLEAAVAAESHGAAGDVTLTPAFQELRSAGDRLGVRCEWDAARNACSFSPRHLLDR